MNVCQSIEDDGEQQTSLDRPRSAEGGQATNQEEFDFVDHPTEEFFCPVTFELLLNPHQTTCCGHHLSEKAVTRLQREDKPCPMCKESKLVTMPDKFFKRKASAVLIRCPYKESECEWVGEVGGAKQHTTACPKRPWKCEHCEFTSTFDIGVQHVEQCTKYPVPCPNKCEISMVPRCDVEKHRTECPLESVACDFVDVGCSVKVARRDLKRHMEESQQQHLLSATLLNLKLTKETIAEKDRLLALKEQQLAEQYQQLADKDNQLDEKDNQIANKDHQIADKDNQLAEKDRQLAEKDKVIAVKDHQIADKDNQLAEKDRQLAEKDKIIAMKDEQALEILFQLQQGIVDVTISMMSIHGFSCHKFTLEEFSKCQNSSEIFGDWYSEPFCIHPGSRQLKLDVETKQQGDYMIVRLKQVTEGSVLGPLIFRLELLNQLDGTNHFCRMFESSINSTHYHTDPCYYIQFKELYKKDETVQYLKDDSLKFVLWIKIKR